MDFGDEEPIESGPSLSFPILPEGDVHRVVETIQHLFSSQTSGDPLLAKTLQGSLHEVQQSPQAWGLIQGLALHEDPNVRFFSAHTAQIKISRDWETLPAELRPGLLALLLELLGSAISPLNPYSFQPGNGIVIRKLFGCLASLLLRLPFYQFPNPITTVLQTISTAAAQGSRLPSSLPVSGYNTPTNNDESTKHRMKLYSLEWCGMCVEEMGRAGISDQKRQALRKHIEMDLQAVMATIKGALDGAMGYSSGIRLEENVKEAEAGCRCAESWIGYGLGADELTTILPSLYNLLPLPAASSALVEALSESIFKFGKGTKVLTEPLLAWIIGPPGQALLGIMEGEPTEDLLGFAKLLCALIEHSSEWLVARLSQNDVQSLLGAILRLTGWQGLGGVDEEVSQLTLPIYPLIQEAVMDSEIFSTDHETDPNWAIAKHFFRELVEVTRRKVRWPDTFVEMDKEDKDSFDIWRVDAGEVIVGAYYILREEMLASLLQIVGQQIEVNAQWEDVEATLHCLRHSAEAVALGEEKSLPILFSDTILGRLAVRPLGDGEDRLRLTIVCLIRNYEEWFKYHPDHLLPVLNFLVPTLTASPYIAQPAADSLKALCDICRSKLVQHIGAFSELHGKIGTLGATVIEAITSVIQALSPADAIGPVEGIVSPILERLSQAISSYQADASTQPDLFQAIEALTACFQGLTPSDDDMFDDIENDQESRLAAITATRSDLRMVHLRQRCEQRITEVIQGWKGDSEIGDAIHRLVKTCTLASSETLISISPLPILTLVSTACSQSPSYLWMSLAALLVLRINTPPPGIFKKVKSPEEIAANNQADQARWSVIADAAGKLVVVAISTLGQTGAIAEHPDVAEAWFSFSSAIAARYPGVLVRLPSHLIEGFMALALLGLSAQERFSLTKASEFFIALLSGTRYPSPLETLSDPILQHFGPQILRSLLLSAGSAGPRSVIPNLAELLAGMINRLKAEDMSNWISIILAEEGFPDRRATEEAKKRLKEAVMRGRTTKKMREALHDFALVARGLDGTTYGNATGF